MVRQRGLLVALLLMSSKPALSFFQLGRKEERSIGSPPASAVAPPAPTPFPLPAGSAGAVASVAGIASSIFLTLAGLLLLGVLPAMRRLRLASEPWRVAPLVLIPERPG
jgi:hypothetical protein